MAFFEKTRLVNEDNNLVGATNPLPVVDTINAEAQQSVIGLLTRMLNYLNAPLGYDKSIQRSRQSTIIESGTITTVSAVTAVTAVTTVGTVSNQTAIGGIQAQILPNGANMSAWQAAVRARIT